MVGTKFVKSFTKYNFYSILPKIFLIIRFHVFKNSTFQTFKNVCHAYLFRQFKDSFSQSYTIYGPLLFLLGNEAGQKIDANSKSVSN